MHGMSTASGLVVLMTLSAAVLHLLAVSGSFCGYTDKDTLLRTFQGPDDAIKLVGLAVQAAAIVTEIDLLLIILLSEQKIVTEHSVQHVLVRCDADHSPHHIFEFISSKNAVFRWFIHWWKHWLDT
jgi:hypothetical protein